MKKTIFIISLSILFLTICSPVLAADPINQQIDELKNKVASKVAELNLVEKRGIIGTVVEVRGNAITLNDSENNTRYVDVDELTKFTSDAKDTYGLSDIKKGDGLGVIGLYNKDSRRLLARFVDAISVPQIIVGAVSKIDKDTFTVTVVTADGKKFDVDVEDITKSFYLQNGTLVKSGFSKIKLKENVAVYGFSENGNASKISASTLVHFPNIPPNPNITIPENVPNPTSTIVPSTGSGKKVTPISQ